MASAIQYINLCVTITQLYFCVSGMCHHLAPVTQEGLFTVLQDCTWRLGPASESLPSRGAEWLLHFPAIQDSEPNQRSGSRGRLCGSADRTGGGPAIFFDWPLFRRPSAATSC